MLSYKLLNLLLVLSNIVVQAVLNPFLIWVKASVSPLFIVWKELTMLVPRVLNVVLRFVKAVVIQEVNKVQVCCNPKIKPWIILTPIPCITVDGD